MQPPLTPEEEDWIHQSRRLARTYKDWTATLVGQFRSGRQQVRLRITYDRLYLTGLTETEFDALD